MVEMMMEKLTSMEETFRNRVEEVDTEPKKKRAIKKVTPDSKRQKTAKICDMFEQFKVPTMTQQGHVTVYGTKHSGVNL